MNNIWIVSYYDDISNQITVTAFDNYEAAYKMYEHECLQYKHNIVNIDETPIYKNYFID